MNVVMCLILGDGKLSNDEFLTVMKNWKLRSFKVSSVLTVNHHHTASYNRNSYFVEADEM